VDSKHNWNTSCLSMAYRLLSLWHHIIISCNYDDGHISYLSTTCTHRRKGLVTRCIKEGDFLTIFQGYTIGTNVLCNTSTLSGNYILFTDIIQQRCFTVVNVTHHSNNWSSWLKIFRLINIVLLSILKINCYKLNFVSKLISNDCKCFSI